MSSLLVILLSTVLVNIVALTGEPRWRAFAAAGTFEGAAAIAIAGLITVPCVAVASWLLGNALLEPWGLGYLRTPAFVAIVLTVVPFVEMALRRYSALLPQRPAFAVLMAMNATVLGVALLSDSRLHDFIAALRFSIEAAGALAVLLLAFAALYERLRHADVPAIFRGAPLALVTAGIMALAFMGFTGLVQE